MGIMPRNYPDPVVGSTAAAIVFTALTRYYAIRRLELCSEVVCWVILPLLFKYARSPKPGNTSRLLPNAPQKPQYSSASQWLVAFGVASAAFFTAESNAIGFYPILTPLLLSAQIYLQPSTTSSDSHRPSCLTHTIWGTWLVATPSVWSLSNGDLLGSLVSLILVVSLLVVYTILLPDFRVPRSSLLSVDIEATIKTIAFRINILLVAGIVFQRFVLGPPTTNILSVLISGLLKAASWFFTIQTARQTSWCIATTLGTFSLACTRNPFSQSSHLLALSHVGFSELFLYQTFQLLPKQAKGKPFLWIFFSLSAVPYIFNDYMVQQAQSLAESTFSGTQVHPVETLTLHATDIFNDVLKSQSKDNQSAIAEYRKRYGIEPPPGFEAWFQFAKEHQSPIIDEFDTIHKSISPFLKRSGKEVSDTMTKLHKTKGSEVWLCEFAGKTGKTKCRHPHRSFDRHYSLLFNELFSDLAGVLPDVKFLINHFDEPRVMIPDRSKWDKSFRLEDLSLKPTWKTLTSHCPPPQLKSRSSLNNDINTFGLPFATNHSSEIDLCQHPEYKDLHGAFLNPKTFQLIEGLAPVMSTGAFSTMGDILFPSPAYVEDEFLYEPQHDIPWSQKKDNLYWTGSTTGGYALDGQWRNHQRQRFVSLAQNLDRQPHSYLREINGVVSKVKSWFLNGRLYDVGFTRIFQCDRKYCRDQKTYFDVKSWANKDKAFGSKLVYDLDGNGVSGRYYKLLASNSLPLKQALLREWHDERLMPWVHYIPVSQSLEELPELVTYLTSTKAGKKLAERIANQGRDWMGQAVRKVDMAVYTYRLLLEMVRLQDPAREAS
ncbi:related to capsule-associated protein [Fusarium torulosum]|uniref:Related to capsule-associated protein n=1 Tax=Fusarium torulosum TaxID=33205 RepID=A0AAE8M1D7_9HYPO|nr:related to capsule-associated protein [Fusarium torulosum]